jgi:Carbohydrate esterase, sialic acid-specific acetylesterase
MGISPTRRFIMSRYWIWSMFALVLLSGISFAQDTKKRINDDLPRPDGKPADMTKPVKVFILMGQSNMLEMGNITGDKDGTLEFATKKEQLYPFLRNDSGWTTRQDVRMVAVMGSGGPGKTQARKNEWLTVSGSRIGVEQGIGHHLGNALDEPVMLLKSAIGNRSLGWDLLPPGSPSYEFQDPKDKKTYIYAGYGQSPERWEKGTEPKPITWKAGLQYDGDIARAKEVLANLGKHYPGATKYEVAGFFWWQGDKDRYNPGHAEMYERNLAALITSLRKEFEAPNAKFVCATLGQTDKANPTGTEKSILEAKFAIADAKKHPEFAGTVATVYTHPLSMGGSSNAHYGNNAKTYMNVGLGMGEAMVKLLADKK